MVFRAPLSNELLASLYLFSVSGSFHFHFHPNSISIPISMSSHLHHTNYTLTKGHQSLPQTRLRLTKSLGRKGLPSLPDRNWWNERVGKRWEDWLGEQARKDATEDSGNLGRGGRDDNGDGGNYSSRGGESADDESATARKQNQEREQAQRGQKRRLGRGLKV